jgi:hypothetical protein
MAEEEANKKWWIEHRWRYVEGRDPNILGNGDCDRTDNPQTQPGKNGSALPQAFSVA